MHITIGDDDIREGLAFEILSKQDLTGVALALTTAAPKRGSLGKGERERERVNNYLDSKEREGERRRKGKKVT